MGDDKPADVPKSWEDKTPSPPAAEPVVAKADDNAAFSSSSEYEKLLFGDKTNKPSWDTEASPEPAVHLVASPTEDVAPVSSPNLDYDTFASKPAVATDAVATEPAAEVAPVVAVAPSDEKFDGGWKDIFARGASANSEVKDSLEAKPVEPVAVAKASSPDVPVGSDDFSVWSALKSLDTAASNPSDNDSATVAAPAQKETDWPAIANGGLWGADNANLGAAVQQVAAEPKANDDAITSMQHLLQDNSLLQKSKKGINKGMVSIKLHRSK